MAAKPIIKRDTITCYVKDNDDVYISFLPGPKQLCNTMFENFDASVVSGLVVNKFLGKGKNIKGKTLYTTTQIADANIDPVQNKTNLTIEINDEPQPDGTYEIDAPENYGQVYYIIEINFVQA